jgi:hypothetical protein
MGVMLLLAFGLRAYRLDYQSLWRDEMDALRFARFPFSRLLGSFGQGGWNGPLYFLLLRAWVAAAGQTEFALRYLSLLGGVLTVPLTYVLARRLGSSRLALYGSGLVAVSPYLVWYSQEAKMYALLVSMAVLSWYLYLRALEEGDWSLWIGYVAVTSLCMYLHILAVLIIPTQAVVFLLRWGRYRGRLRPWLGAMAALILPYLPLAWWQIPLLFSDFQSGHAFYPLSQIFVNLLQAFSLGVTGHPTLRLHLLSLVGGSSGISVYEGLLVVLFLGLAGALLYPDRRSLQLLFSWILLPPLILYLISLQVPLYSARYLIWIAPAFLLLLAAGLVAVREQSRVVFVLCLVGLLLVNGPALLAQSHFPVKSDFRKAAAHVKSLRQDDEPVLFLIPYVRYTFEYYYGPSDPWVGAPYTNDGMSSDGVDKQLREAVGDAGSVWFVSSEPELWDERGLVSQWLEDHGSHVDEMAFARVMVIHYALQD